MGRKLKVVEHNEEKKNIILEEEDNKIILFFKNYGKILFSILFLLALIVGMLSIVFATSNFGKSSDLTNLYEDLKLDFNGYEDIIFGGGMPITSEYANSLFDKYYNNILGIQGEVLVTKIVNLKNGKIIYFTDKTALKITSSKIIRISARNNGKYGIKEDGSIYDDVVTREVTIVKTKTYSFGTVTYYSDGSAYIESDTVNMFVRDSKDINENYISDSKVSYILKEENIGKYKVIYYKDGTINIKNDNNNYLVRNKEDVIISSNDLSFPNDNVATIIKTVKCTNSIIINYYSDGGAIIIQDGNQISVRKSNSIVIKDNNLYEIVNSNYIEVTSSRKINNGIVYYYNNGGAIIDYNDKKDLYVFENSNIKYKNDDISVINEKYEIETSTKEINNKVIKEFETVVYINPYNDKMIILDKGKVIIDENGNVTNKEDNTLPENIKVGKFTITNNYNDTMKYRIVIEESNKTTLSVNYIKYLIQVNGEKQTNFLDNNVWNIGSDLANGNKINSKTYIIKDDSLEPLEAKDVYIMLWTDYETIGNDMMDKQFLGTIRVYGLVEK